MALTDVQKASLLRIAREAVVSHLSARPMSDIACELPEASGAFVTIKRRGELRGCIGTLECRAIKVSCLIPRADVESAVRALHAAFALGER